ncbi:AAA family ATPase [Pseudosulfitobacter sp. SM2401]|uniref:bifunctional aminoglycoside phosphotransferase/ATP-binding protein n=1 Tax=Pseudosulfitobacter sp. SM2401 TaxID=3350098 RepID=UPI0036F3E52E
MTQTSQSFEKQDEVIAFLSSGDTHPGGAPVDVVQTHGAIIFLAGDVALKIKRAVCYDYMDLSTLDLREKMIRRELALNQPIAPEIYQTVIPVTRAANGQLALDGDGIPVEWVLRMRRFPTSDELSVIADEGRLDDALARDLGQSVFDYHAKTPQRTADGATLITDILDELDRVFAELDGVLDTALIARFHAQSHAALNNIEPLLRQRSAEGHVRRCHGDLHLRNLVMLGGKPVPFDALEFDEVLGTCDVLYDLAFLIMDLRHRALDRAANIVLGSYLLAAMGNQDNGLTTLPLFIAVRAAIRAMVAAQTALATGSPIDKDATLYLAEALAVLSPPEPVLVLIGGLSGSGKTTVAQEVAPKIGAAPGAVLLRSDTERKAMRGAAPSTRLGASAYTPTARTAIYDRIIQRARNTLNTGHSVLIDATFLNPDDRERATNLTAGTGIALHRFWLEAPPDILIDRVTARRGDASDADADVVRAQVANTAPPHDWTIIAAAGSIADTALRIDLVLREAGAIPAAD